jgi:hypothetical protein
MGAYEDSVTAAYLLADVKGDDSVPYIQAEIRAAAARGSRAQEKRWRLIERLVREELAVGTEECTSGAGADQVSRPLGLRRKHWLLLTSLSTLGVDHPALAVVAVCIR